MVVSHVTLMIPPYVMNVSHLKYSTNKNSHVLLYLVLLIIVLNVILTVNVQHVKMDIHLLVKPVKNV